jgi:UDP-N-acetylmuramate--alanine ligase
MVGVKGVGMTALAEILVFQGARVTGSDTPEVFFTDAILDTLGVPVSSQFQDQAVTAKTDLVIYSAAYSPDTNPELKRAGELDIPCLVYPQALGQLSASYDAAGVSGVHGKTTTSALAGVIVKALALPATVLVGSQVPGFDNHATFLGGNRYFVAETCEYKRHFLYFHPRRLIITSIEEDHQDYFRDIEDISQAFVDYALRLPREGILIYCADDRGVGEVVSRLTVKRPDIKYIPYGEKAQGPYHITAVRFSAGTTHFRLDGFSPEFTLHLPGRHSIANAAGAIALAANIAEDDHGHLSSQDIDNISHALDAFTGTRRRCEILGQAQGILFMDDYAHHPTAIRSTLDGIKTYYPDKRIIVDFMSHTYSRTAALLEDFAGSFSSADEVVLHNIYASARERYDGSVTGEMLYIKTRDVHPSVTYFPEPICAESYLKTHLTTGDLFLTMGAGDNWKLGRNLYHYFNTQGVPE